MKVIAAIQIDLETTPLGTRSRLRDELGGVSIFWRTVKQAERIQPPIDIFVLCPQTQESETRNLLADSRAIVQTHDAGPPPWNALIRASRKWSLDGWRGGIGQTISFDEFIDCRVLAGLLTHAQADAILAIPPAAPFFSPEFAQKMIRQRIESGDEDTRIIFSAAPPGIAGVLLDASLIRELALNNLPLSWIFAYQPEHPRKDMIFLPCACEVPAPLRFASGRLCADSDRSFERAQALWDASREEPNFGLQRIGDWLIEHEKSHVDLLPHELEIELTTDDSLPNARLRPRGNRLERNASIEVRTVGALFDEVTEFDDSLVVLGGFGDPLRHPEFNEVLSAIRSVRRSINIYGLAVRTSGVNLTDESIVALIEHRVDVLEILLDAWTPATYARVQSTNGKDDATLQHVLSRIERVEEMRRERSSVFPLIVPSFTKSRENVHELDDFYDGWTRRLGAVCITGANHYSRQFDDQSVIPMAPATRTACRRIMSRCLVLADGRVTMCDQDFQGLHTVGSLHEHSLSTIWRNTKFQRIRADHASDKFQSHELCAACDEWHRP
ncbi:MAG: SPASM domain-containing protein [Planctomycetes bacterium]|nr:SPASM domain-containing protein [Planctomycetota bacterium]MBI3835243.1 SPASM domain-containing protein [Planctomycetota bacterium]